MGHQLVSFFAKAKAIGGIKAQMRLAMLTLIHSKKAESLPDAPEYIEKFQKALLQLERETAEAKKQGQK